MGYRITSSVRLNKMWGTSVDVLETHRIFRIEDNGKSPEDQLYEQCNAAGKDLFDRLDFIYKANSGLLDREGFTVRFNA